ncbi:Complement C1q-like protein 4 [Chionoecetes opilio]|uniref:Complement C1q-like protein 4 n=1 Tax=Chionoecetes opilio TaxID=41210 RepID=A0A8J4XZB7_CHIOP|nr:Complement C1q-like protein 4 [Chionoecetes opilio]
MLCEDDACGECEGEDCDPTPEPPGGDYEETTTGGDYEDSTTGGDYEETTTGGDYEDTTTPPMGTTTTASPHPDEDHHMSWQSAHPEEDHHMSRRSAHLDEDYHHHMSRPSADIYVEPRHKVCFSLKRAAVYHAEARMQFKDLLTNTGHGWNSPQAHFVAPYSGCYFFIYHAVTKMGHDFTLSLVKNGKYQVTAYGTQGKHQHGSNSAVLNLERYDKVHLQLRDGSIYEHPHSKEAYTTFSGFLIFTN